MKLCLKCFSLWPGNTVFCGKCRRALGTKRCPKGHANPLSSPAVTCLICNEGPLDGVPCLPLGGVASLLALLLLVGVWRWGWQHPDWVLGTVWRVGLWTLGVLFAAPPRGIQWALRQTLAWYVTLWLLSYALPPSAGRAARQTLKRLPRQVGRGVRSLLRLLVPLVRHAADRGKVRVESGRSNETH